MFDILFNSLNSMNFSLILLIVFVFYVINKLVNNRNLENRLKVLESQFKDVNHDKRAESYPSHYPNGWLPILESQELKRGQIKPIFAFGQDLVVYRGLSGKVYVMDAYCPHLGANIGVGGTVVGDQIECWFHGWRFDHKGACTFIPGIDGKSIPGAKIKTWESMEINGFIYAWNHSNGKKSDWVIPDHVGTRINRGKTESMVNCHVQDIWENIPDYEHLFHIHENFERTLPILFRFVPRSIIKFFKFGYELEWEPCDAPDKHMARFKITSTVLFMKLVYKGYICGPATLLGNIELNFFGKNNFLTVGEVITLSPLRAILINRIYSEPTIKGFLISKVWLALMINLLQADIAIWNYKKYQRKAILTKNDTTIKSYRGWYQQFYQDQFDSKIY